MSVYLKIGGQSYTLTPTESVINFLDGMVADYGDLAHRKMRESIYEYEENNDMEKSGTLNREALRLRKLSEEISVVAEQFQTAYEKIQEEQAKQEPTMA